MGEERSERHDWGPFVTSGIKVLFVGKGDWKLPEYHIEVCTKVNQLMTHLGTFRPDVVVSSEFIPGALNIAAFDVRRKWIHVNPQANAEDVSRAIEACYGASLWGEHPFANTNPLVTVYTGTYNTGDFLRDTYQSLRDQSYPNWEWLVVDDGSTDGTWERLLEIANEDFRVNPVRIRHNGKIGHVKGVATKLARGKYLVELDHDDMLTDTAIDEVRKAFESDPEIGFVYTNCASFFQDGNPQMFGDEFWKPRYRDTVYRNKTYKECINPNIMDRFGPHFSQQFGWFLTVGPNHIRAYRADKLQEFGGYNHNLPVADDWDVYAKFFLRSKCFHLDKMLYLYRFMDSFANTTFTRNKSIQDHLALGRGHYAKEFDEFNKKRLLSIPDVGFVVASRNEETSKPIREKIFNAHVIMGKNSILEAYEDGRNSFKGTPRIVYIHDDASILDMEKFVNMVKALPPGLYGAIGSASPGVLDKGPWWESDRKVGKLQQRVYTGKMKLLEFGNADTIQEVQWLDGFCLIAVEQNWSWLVRGNPPLWHGYDWLACKRTTENGGKCFVFPQPEQPMLAHNGLGGGETYDEAMEIIRSLTKKPYERDLYINLHEHCQTLATAKGQVLDLGCSSNAGPFHEGIATNALLEGVEKNGGEVWSVESNDLSKLFKGHKQWHFIQTNSLDEEKILNACKKTAFDLIFIDTEHSYDRTKKELELWGKRVNPGGRIILHDHAIFSGIDQAIKEYAANKDVKVEQYPNGNGLTIITMAKVESPPPKPESVDGPRVVASLTTIPSRISRIRPMLESVIAQTYKPSRIVLWLPTICQKEGVGYDIPSELSDWMTKNGIEIGRCDQDWGSATKLIPTLLSESDPETKIITLDDDVSYEPHAIEELVKASDKWPDAAIGFMGRINKEFVHAEKVLKDPVEVGFLGGYRGVLYRRRFFDQTIYEDMRALLVGGPVVVDDHVFAWYLRDHGIKKLVIRTEHPGKDGSINMQFLNLGGGIYDKGEEGPVVKESMQRLEDLYGKKTISNLSVIVLDWNTKDMTLACVDSVRKHYPDVEIILIQNGEAFDCPKATRVLPMEINLGYSAGVNRGVYAATKKHICLLNSDTVVEPGLFEKLEMPFYSDPTLGITGPFLSYGRPPQGNYAKANCPQTDLELPLVFVCVMMERDLLLSMGGLDPRLTTYEDDDFCLRTKQRGLKTKVIGGTWINHSGHESFKANEVDTQTMNKENHEKFLKKWPKIKVIALTKDEKEALPGFFDQFRPITDKFAILDSGSTDGTLEWAKANGIQVAERDFDRFDNQRNASIELLGKDAEWIIQMDPDERLDAHTIQCIPELVRSVEFDIYLTHLFALNRDCSSKEWIGKPFLWRNNLDIRWALPVHEKLIGSMRQAWIKNGRIDHVIALHNPERRAKSEGFYSKLASLPRIDVSQWPIIDYDHPMHPGLKQICIGPLVSIVIPTCNRFELRSKAEDSIRKQDYRPFEAIIVGDGPGSIGGITGIQGEGADLFRYYTLPKNHGAGGAVPRNYAITLSAGNWIAYCDDDNQWEPTHLSSLMEAVEKEGAAFGISSMKILGKERICDKPEFGKVDTSCVLHAKELVRKYGWWKNRLEGGYCHDWEFVSRWVKSEKWAASLKTTVLYNAETSGQFEFLKKLVEA